MGWFKMPPASVFAQPSSVRGTLNTIQHGGREHYVSTEAQLLQAIGKIAAGYSVNAAGLPSSFGGSIAIVAPIRATRTPFVIPETCVGLTIRSIGNAPIVADGADQGVLFQCAAPFVSLRDLFVFFGGASGAATSWFNTVLEVVAGTTLNPLCARLVNCTGFVDRLFVDSSAGGADGSEVRGCRIQSSPNGTHDASIMFDSPACTADDNRLNDGGGDSVTIGANALRCHTTANDLDGGDYTSTASGGFNTFSGNTNVATVTAHATDDTLGGNTA